MRRIRWAGLAGLTCGVATIAGCASGPRDVRDAYQTESRLLTLKTQPPGAKVTQILVPDDTRVVLGYTPFERQPVEVLTRLNDASIDAAAGVETIKQFNAAKVRIQLQGYEPWEGLIPLERNVENQRTITLELAKAPGELSKASTTQPAE